MVNLLKSDFYKMKRHTALYVCTFVVMFYMAYIVIDFRSSADMVYQISTSTFHWVYLMFYEQSFLPYVIPIVQSIFITLFITNDYQAGTIKDPVALGFNRSKIYLSKFFVLSVATLFILFMAVLTTVIIASLTFGIYGSFTGMDLLSMFGIFLVQVLLFSAYGALFLVLSIAIRNAGAAMAFNVIFSLVLISLPSVLQGTIWDSLLLMSFEEVAMPNPPFNDLLMAIGVAMVHLVITLGIGTFIFNKQEIK